MVARIKKFLKYNRHVFAAFFLTFIIAVLLMLAKGIYPFGTTQIAIIDMYHQYLPFLTELQEKLQDGGSLFFSWNGAGGSNFWNLISYYGASPLNLLLVLFPKDLTMEAVTLILVIKLGLASAFMTVFLRYTCSRCNMATAAFSQLYALCSYVMAYYWCIMWMDAVMLLPLCMLGLHKIIDQGKFVLYTVCLALIVLCNYYIAIMVCIFILCYYPVLYFTKVRKGGIRRCLVTAGKAAGCSLLGIAISAVMLLPTYISMQDTYYISMEMPEEWETYSDALNVINQLLPNAHLTIRSGAPNLYCGLIVVILLVFFVISRTIPLREKVLNLSFMAFMFLSLNLNKLDFIWHGFHFPNQLPYRYSFVICFLLVGMACRTFMHVDEFRVKSIWAVLAAGIGYYVLAQKLLKDDLDDVSMFFYGGILFLILYCVIFLVYRKAYIKKTAFLLLIAVVITTELIAAGSASLDISGTTSRDAYNENRTDIQSLADSVKDEFARTELTGSSILNCPALYGYKGLSQFSSTLNARTTEFMEKIGLDGEPGKNRFTYNRTVPVIDSMLNVKYLISKNQTLDDEQYMFVKQEGNSYLYENIYPLAAGYMTSESIRTWDTDMDNPFAVLDDYVRAATDGAYSSVFQDIGKPRIISDTAEITEDDSHKASANLSDADSGKSVTLRYSSEKTQEYYLFIEADYADVITVKKENDVEETEIRNDCGSIVDIGKIKKGETFDVVIEYEAEDAGRLSHIKSYLCSFDTDTWGKVYKILSANTMEVTDWDDTHVSGRVTADNDGVLVSSIPYENGWTLKVDGRETKISELTGGALISVPLKAGEHSIELSFRPPGITAAFLITCGGILLLVLLEFARRKCLIAKLPGCRRKRSEDKTFTDLRRQADATALSAHSETEE